VIYHRNFVHISQNTSELSAQNLGRMRSDFELYGTLCWVYFFPDVSDDDENTRAECLNNEHVNKNILSISNGTLSR